MSGFARLAQIAEQSRWPCARRDMIEPSAVVRRMIEDLETLVARDAPMTIDALIALGWADEAAWRFHPAALESATAARALSDLANCLSAPRERLTPPSAANDDADVAPRLYRREARAFLAGAGAALMSAMLIVAVMHLLGRSLR